MFVGGFKGFKKREFFVLGFESLKNGILIWVWLLISKKNGYFLIQILGFERSDFRLGLFSRGFGQGCFCGV